MIEFKRGNQRIPDYGIKPDPLTWDYPVIHSGMMADHEFRKDLALCTCPFGHTTRVSPKNHSIADDGTVSPSYVCTVPGCTFHDNVRFVGWARK